MTAEGRCIVGRRIVAILATGSLACPSPPAGTDTYEPCTFASCEAECREVGLTYGSCAGGRCHCSGGDADADESSADDAGSDVRPDVVDTGDDGDLPPCDGIRIPVEERTGAGGLRCRRLSVPEVEASLLDFAGQGRFVAFRGGGERPRGLRLLDTSTMCLRVLDDLADALVPEAAGVVFPSVEGDRVAYAVVWSPPGTGQIETWQLRLADIMTGEHRVLVETLSQEQEPSGYGGQMDFVTLRYPWITWRDVREANLYRWLAYAYNVETGEERNLSGPVGSPDVWATVRVDSDGRTAAFHPYFSDGTEPYHDNVVTVDLETGDRRRIAPSTAAQWWPSFAGRWIVYLDQRNHPECNSDSPCCTDVFAYNLDTGEERALVVAGNSMQGPWMDAEGDWALYEDQRDGTDVTQSRDREQDMYAFHLPTMTEVRVTDWPGFEMYPSVWDRLDGTYAALFLEEIDYGAVTYRLWACDLPDLSGD